MKDYVWKHRIVLGLLFILVVQAPFVIVKLTTADRGSLDILVEVGHLLATSGLAAYLFSRTFESRLEKGLYQGLRRNWREVRVMYSDDIGKGMGDAYPREPTLLIQAHTFERPGAEDTSYTPEDPLFALSRNGGIRAITAPAMHGPVCMSFNSGFVGRPADGETTWVTGTWSELQIMQVGFPEMKLTRVGFPDTLITLGRVIDEGD